MDKEILEKYLLAGKIASEVREESRKFISVGSPLFDIAEKIEALIIEKGGSMAFPVNLSLNEFAAHCTPKPMDETKIKESDVLKVDIGTHIDGYVGDTAYTISFDEKYDALVKASEAALDNALKLCTPGTLLSDVSATIEDTINSFEFKPVSNLTGHGLEQYSIHAEPSVPNVKFESDFVLEKNMIIAIEPFATVGTGLIKEYGEPAIFSLVGLKPVRNNDARKIISFAEKINGLPFTERWLMKDVGSLFKIRIAMREMKERNILYEYPPLMEVARGIVSQAEHTVIVGKEPIVTTKLSQ
ncbi:MAG: type II methionyl aminopeptidase [Candidatus Aenigmatarchaeota archaeon]